jgi:AcrR family transcriptional regulator
MPRDETEARIVDALMTLAAEAPWNAITLPAIAARAGIPLSELRSRFDGRLAILGAYMAAVDSEVLDGIDPGLASEAPRERLFDVLFARFEAHKPHKAAIRGIMRAALTDPALALALNGLVVRSMVWMLAGANIEAEGRRGLVRAQGLALLWARVMRVFLDDEDPGLGRTMAALDKRLREAERLVLRVERLEGLVDRGRARLSRKERPAADEDLSEGHPS